jgi:hypothetical protein
MSEEAAFDTMADDLFDQLGVDATFTPATGDPVALKVVFKSMLAMQPTSYETRSWQGEDSIEFVLDDLGREPNRGETFTVESTVYTVQGVVANDGRFCTVAVT